MGHMSQRKEVFTKAPKGQCRAIGFGALNLQGELRKISLNG